MLDKKKIKLNAFFDPPLLGKLDTESDIKMKYLDFQIQQLSALKSKAKVDERKARLEVLKASSPKTPVASLLAKKFHGLQSPSLEDLRMKKKLPDFTKNFEIFEKQSMKRKIEMAGELLDTCISHSIVSQQDKIRLKKKRPEMSKASGGTHISFRPEFLEKATEDLLSTCKSIKIKDSILEPSRITVTLDEKFNAAFEPSSPKGSSHTKTSSQKKSFLLRGEKSPQKIKKPYKKIHQHHHSELSLANTKDHLTPRKLKEEGSLPLARTVHSIKAGELFPKLKILFKDSKTLLSVRPNLAPLASSFTVASIQ